MVMSGAVPDGLTQAGPGHRIPRVPDWPFPPDAHFSVRLPLPGPATNSSRTRVDVPSARPGMQTSDLPHSVPWNRRQIVCYVGRVAVLISVDVFQRLMGYPKPSGRFFVFRVVSTRVINAAA